MDTFTENTEGVFFGLPHHIYRKAPGINISSLKLMAKSPKTYKHGLDNPKETTAAMIFGTVVHAMLLEPETVSSMVVTRPDKWDSWRTNDSKAWKSEREAEGKLVVSSETFEEMTNCAAAVKTDPKAAWILQRAEKEVSIFKRHERTGLLLKGRIDLPFSDLQENIAIADIKKVPSVKRSLFQRAIGEHLHHASLAYYSDLIGASSGYLIAVEEQAPHEMDIFKLAPASLQRGRDLYESLLDKLAWCQKNDRWPGVSEDSNDIQEIEEPAWAVSAETLPY